MMIKKIIPILCLFFTSFSLWAQEVEISGMVIDSSNNEPVIGALVKFNNEKKVVTDIDGKFSFRVTLAQGEIIVESAGFTSYIQKITSSTILPLTILLSTRANQLETVVISAGKYDQKLEEVTVSMTVIKPNLLENKNTVNCETVMEQVPGVTVQDGQVSMRGGSGFAYGAGSRVLLLVDDMPMLSGDASDIKWNALPVENIEQIEVMKGASSVLYGSGALNGVIHVRTAYPTDEPVTKINVTHGMYGDPKRDSLRWWRKGENPYYTGAYFLHARKVKQMDVVAGGAFYDDGGYREGETEQRFRGNLGLRYRPKKNSRLNYGVNGNYSQAKGGLFIIWKDQHNGYSPSGGANPDSAGSTLSRFDNFRYNIDPYLNYFTKKGDRHSVRMRYFNTTNRNQTDTVNQNSIARIYYWEYQFQYKLKGDWRFVSGAAGYLNTIDSYLYGDHTGTNVAAYTQVDKKFFNRLNLSAGVRLEYFKLDAEETVSTYSIIRNGDTTSLPVQPVFRAGLNYQLTKSTFLRTSFGQGYRFPSVTEKYVTTSVGSLNFFSNPNLKPEYGWSAEGGVKQVLKIGNWKGFLDVAYFYTRYKNMTEFTFGVYSPPGLQLTLNPNDYGNLFNWVGFRAENAEEAQISGVEIELAGTGKIGKFEISTLIGYTYMNPITLNNDEAYRASFSDTTTNILKYRFKHLFKADLQVDYGVLSFGASLRYNSYMVNVDQTFYNLQIPTAAVGFPLNLGDQLLKGFPSYRNQFNTGSTVIDVRLMFKLSKTTKLGINANNLLNTEYMGRPGDIQAPRNIAMQLNLKF
jgi:outer membrane receptor protein involved in Fe transport